MGTGSKIAVPGGIRLQRLLSARLSSADASKIEKQKEIEKQIARDTQYQLGAR